jgi:hypothetical protein
MFARPPVVVLDAQNAGPDGRVIIQQFLRRFEASRGR